MKEQLHTRPTCGIENFTRRGLKAHRCKGINRNNTSSMKTPTKKLPEHAAALREALAMLNCSCLDDINELSPMDYMDIANDLDIASRVISEILFKMRNNKQKTGTKK